MAILGGILATTLPGAEGCAEVPKEAVQLSYQIGQDLPRLHESYDGLIHARFEDFRARRRAYLEEVWIPDYLAKWLNKGRLVDVAKGDVVWSFEAGKFVAPTAGKANAELLATVKEWAEQAVAKIEQKRAELMAPLDRSEQELRGQVKEAFDRVIQANAYLTAHLESVRHVSEAQDEGLKALRLKHLRDSINKTLIAASDEAAQGLEKVRAADGLVGKAGATMGSLR